MDATVGMHLAHLRDQAAHYRKLAKGAVPWHVAERLDRWADECDKTATRLVSAYWTVAAAGGATCYLPRP